MAINIQLPAQPLPTASVETLQAYSAIVTAVEALYPLIATYQASLAADTLVGITTQITTLQTAQQANSNPASAQITP